MKHFILSIALLALAACGEQTSPPRHIELSQLHGRWVLINYWAEWCKPCITEIPELNEFSRQRSADASVVGVNYDGAQGQELDTQVEKLGIEFSLLLQDPAAALGYERPLVLPTTVVIDPQGNIVGTLLGPQTLESLNAATQR